MKINQSMISILGPITAYELFLQMAADCEVKILFDVAWRINLEFVCIRGLVCIAVFVFVFLLVCLFVGFFFRFWISSILKSRRKQKTFSKL